jgi:hypothetical protein
MSAPRHSTAAILAAPTALAILSAAGLASALFGDGLWDAASWLALGSPVAAAAYFMLRPTRR